MVYKRLREIPGVLVMRPKGTFYLFRNISEYGSSEEVAKYLLYNARIVVVLGVSFGKYEEGYIRISCAKAYENQM